LFAFSFPQHELINDAKCPCNEQAEEEALRLVHERNAALATLGPQVDRSRKQDFIDPSVLAECVKKIGKLNPFPSLDLLSRLMT
jgi:hypothetical protein